MPGVVGHIDARIAVVTLDDPASQNAINPDLMSGIGDALDRFESDPSARILVLRSSCRTFSAGMDLAALTALRKGPAGAERLRSAVSRYAELLERIHTSDMPSVALVRGPVRAGGVGLCCACDIVVAQETATFSLSEGLFGLIPANVFAHIVGRRITAQRARCLALTAEEITADHALRIGLADRVYAPADAEKRLRALLKQMLRVAPEAVRELKRFLADTEKLASAQARSIAEKTLVRLVTSPQAERARQALAEGGVPDWFAPFKPGGTFFNQDAGGDAT
jgi:enoyl-CoA hydratase/carnithine racemase